MPIEVRQTRREEKTPVGSPVKFSQTQASALLDLMRGLAALLVLGEHWRNFFFQDFHTLVRHRGLLLAPYILTGAGHAAVMIFFVLSGYLIAGTVFRAVNSDTWTWKSYLTHRLVRLWIVLLPGLVLCLMWDRLGLHLGQAPLTYAGLGDNHMTHDVRSLLTPGIFFGNVFFLQTILTPTLGSDGALWSLAAEFWYYILFPLALLAVVGRRIVSRVACVALFGMLAWFVGWPVLVGFGLWLMGALLVKLRVPRVPASVRWIAGAVYVVLLFAMSRVRGVPGAWADYALGLLTMLLMWILLSAQQEADPRAAWVRISRGLARFSFTLYVAHMPVCLLLASLLIHDSRWVPNGRHVAVGLAVLVVVVAYSWILAWGTEFQTDRVRRWVEARLA